jgi:single-strand DNA-binding protein
MANLNKVMLIGRLTRDPEMRTFANGGKVAKFGFAVNNRRKNVSTGEWEDEPVFLEIDAFNRGESGRQLADLVEQYLRKGHQAFIEGHLRLDQWTSQDGQKRERVTVRLDNLQFLEPRSDGGTGEAGNRFQRAAPATRTATSAPSSPGHFDEPAVEPEPYAPVEPRSDEAIPF